MLLNLSDSVADPGCLSRIPDPDFYPSRIPDPGVKKAPDPGSGSATLLSDDGRSGTYISKLKSLDNQCCGSGSIIYGSGSFLHQVK
jgi:hypothetical protein